MNRLSEDTSQRAFLDLLRQHDLFMSGKARFVHVHEVRTAAGVYYVVQYYENGEVCCAEGIFTGDPQLAGVFFIEWVVICGRKRWHLTVHPHPLPKALRPVVIERFASAQHALALQT